MGASYQPIRCSMLGSEDNLYLTFTCGIFAGIIPALHSHISRFVLFTIVYSSNTRKNIDIDIDVKEASWHDLIPMGAPKGRRDLPVPQRLGIYQSFSKAKIRATLLGSRFSTWPFVVPRCQPNWQSLGRNFLQVDGLLVLFSASASFQHEPSEYFFYQCWGNPFSKLLWIM